MVIKIEARDNIDFTDDWGTSNLVVFDDLKLHYDNLIKKIQILDETRYNRK